MFVHSFLTWCLAIVVILGPFCSPLRTWNFNIWWHRNCCSCCRGTGKSGMPNLIFYTLPHFGGGLQAFITCYPGPHGKSCHLDVLLTAFYQYHVKNSRGKICGPYIQKSFPFPSLILGVVVVCLDWFMVRSMWRGINDYSKIRVYRLKCF